MRFCTECGKELEKDAKVCGNCGKKIVTPETASAGMGQSVPINNNQQYYNNNQYNNAQANQSNGLATAGFVISLVSACCCGSISWLGLIFSIIGLTESKKKNGAGKGLAIAGIVISAVMLFAFIIMMITGVLEGLSESISEGVGTSL